MKCHEVSTRSAQFRCLECHREIAGELHQQRGLHATFPQEGAEGAACVKCHSDHNGEKFNLLHWDPTAKGFDHAKTGYALDGKHAGVSCRSCHQARYIAPQSHALLGTKDLSRTWLGVAPECAACHEDKHGGRFGANCEQCHSTAGWKSAKIDEQHFNHTKTRFQLTGAHLSTACQKCHTAGDDGRPRYNGIAFAACVDCHSDPHKGEFKQGCDSCHNTVTWKKSNFTTAFVHAHTAFPLLGKHLGVGCLKCHHSANFKLPLAHANCADCHNPDPHGGQFAKRADGGRCESCHTVKGWSPGTFTAADHARTGFALVAPHAKAKCADCHAPAGKQTRYKVRFDLCLDCHNDVHEGQFAAEPWRNRCEACHTGIAFTISNYTLARHQKSSFPLTGGHLAVACNECHKPPVGEKTAVYRFKQFGCPSCHTDVHRGEFLSRMAVADATGKPMGCEACHSTGEWKDLAKFDHEHTRFPLIGAHRAVACAECHRPPNMELTMLHVHFGDAPGTCSECHENPHADQFGSKARDCSACHNSNKWRPSLFNHEQTDFSLKGGHQDVACKDCHTLKKPADGKLVLFYKPTPTACADCHGGNVPKAATGSK